MKRKVVTAFLMAALGSSLVFSQAAMAAGTADKTENTAEAGTEEETEDAETADATDAADKDAKDEDLKTIGEKPEGDTEGVFSAKLKNLTVHLFTIIITAFRAEAFTELMSIISTPVDM